MPYDATPSQPTAPRSRYLGSVRHFKGDLRAVIVAHTLQDFIVALLVLARSHAQHLHHPA